MSFRLRMVSSLLVPVAVAMSGGPGVGQSASDRSAVRKRFEELDQHARAEIGPDFPQCGNGTHPVESRLITEETAKLLDAERGLRGGWFDLALEHKPKASLDPAVKWARLGLTDALSQHLDWKSPEDKAFLLSQSEQPRLVARLREAAAAGDEVWSSVDFYFPLRAFESIGDFSSVEALLQIPAKARSFRLDSWLFIVESITGFAPTSPKDGGLLPDPERLAAFESWWNSVREQTPAQSRLSAAKQLQMSRARLGLWAIAHHFSDPAQAASLRSEDLQALLESRWPGETIDSNDQSPREPRVAQSFSFVRDAAFLLLFHRDPESAMHSLGKGLKRNQAVLGQGMDPLHAGHFGNKALLFATRVSPELDAALSAEIRNPKHSPFCRFQWLVIREQFFPPAERQWFHLGVHELVEHARPKPSIQFEVRRILRGMPMRVSPNLWQVDEETLISTLRSVGL